MVRNNKVRLVDIRQIGPNSQRDISGLCSACGTALLARIDSVKVPTRQQLEQALQSLFERHVAEYHERSDGKTEGMEGMEEPSTN